MAYPALLPQLVVEIQAFDHLQRRRLDLGHLVGQHMAFNLHFTQHDIQHTDEIRHTAGQREVDQFDACRYWHPGVDDHQDVAVAQRCDHAGQGDIE